MAAVLALWAGDSFTRGEGAGVPKASTYPFLVGAVLGWRCVVDAQNGTGFVNDGWAAGPGLAPLLDRLPDVVRRCAAEPGPRDGAGVGVVVVDAGRNDAEVPPARVGEAAASYLCAVRAAWPAARIIVVAPTLLDRVQPAAYVSVTGELRAVAPSVGAVVVDPAAVPSFAVAAPGVRLSGPDGFHPGPAGQAHYADILAPLLRDAIAG
jgi:lysophospholipase L1-like esterase